MRTLPLLFALALFAGHAFAAGKPNVLFIFADDMAYDTIACQGNTEIQTPNLDRLAARSTAFRHCYNMGGYHGAVCVASRTMLNTGVFVWHAQREEKRLKSHYQPNGLMWAQLMEKAGYDTYMTGKWHVSVDAASVFGTAKHVRGGMPRQTKEGYDRPVKGQEDVWQPWDKSKGGFWEGGKHWSEVVGDDALEFLDTAKGSENPFFMYIAFNAPHDPRQSPKEYVDRYPLEKISLPKPFLPEYPFKDGIGCGKGLRDEALAPFPRTEYAVKVNRQEYYAIITHMDAQIGRILDALEKSGKAEDTYIFFTADHGLACGHHGLMGKQNMFDHSVRVPFFAAGPNIPAGKDNNTPIYLQDVLPTSLEIAGAEKPEHVQFKSLWPLICGERDRQYDAIYGAYTNTQRMITKGSDKLIVYPKLDMDLLFDLKADPAEENDLAKDPANAAKIAALKHELRALQKEAGDSLALD